MVGAGRPTGDAGSSYFFFLRFLRSRRFLEPTFLLRLGFPIYYLVQVVCLAVNPA